MNSNALPVTSFKCKSVFLAFASLFIAISAQATPILFTPGNTGSNGNGGGTHVFTFLLGANASTAVIDIDIATFDHNFIVQLNGDEIVPVDPGNPAVFSPALSQPWSANTNGLPRLNIELTSAGVSFEGTENTGSVSLTSLTYNQPTLVPNFVVGTNTLTIINPNGAGPDGINFSVTGTVPETGSTFAFLGAGLIGLVAFGKRKKS